MNMIKAYIAYIKDNPEHYWFKRKVYGWGWVPATREGWAVVLAFVAFILAIALRAEKMAVTPQEAVWQVFLPALGAVGLLIFICYRTGEPPKWQWHLPNKYFSDEYQSKAGSEKNR